MGQFDDNEVRQGGQAEALDGDEALDPGGVYDGPRRDGPSAATAIIAVVISLLLLSVAYMLLRATIF